ncbi:MAG: hypothetical protein J6P00_03045 [Acetobacter sp.]|nr:hypothetical protein [Acetobacter sp.]
MTCKALETFDNVLHKTLKTGINTALKAVFQEVYQAFSDTSYLFQQKMLTTCRNEESLQEFSGLLCVFDKKLKFEKSKYLDIENTHKLEEVSLKEKREIYEVRQKGFFGWLFNIKETKYHEYEEASLEVPSLEKIFNDIEESEGMQEATHQIIKEIIKLIDDFNSQLKKILEDGVAEYERAIKGSIGEVTDRTREKNKQLKKYIENIKKLINEKDEPKPK